MSQLESWVREFAELLSKGRSLDAMERFYAPEVSVFENRELARAGKAQCLQYEREALASQPDAPRFKLSTLAVNESLGHAFLAMEDETVGDVVMHRLLDVVEAAQIAARRIDTEFDEQDEDHE